MTLPPPPAEPEAPAAEASAAEASAAEPPATADAAAADTDDPDVSWSDAVATFRGWPWKKRLLVAAATAFAVFHISAVLIRGAPKRYRELLTPPVAWYAEGLRMTDTWGMFSLPPKDKLVSVVGIDGKGQHHELSHVLQSDRDPFQRVVDTRIRKIQTKLADEKSRNHWGRGYVAYFCKQALAQGLDLRRVQVEVQGKGAEETKVYLVQGCRQPAPPQNQTMVRP